MINLNEKEVGLPEYWQADNIRKLISKIPLTGRKLPQSRYIENGKYPVIDQGKKFIGGFSNEELVVTCELPVIVFGDHTKVLKYVDFPFIAGADGVKVIKPSDKFIPKLFYYFLQAIYLPNKGYARHFQYLEQATIPIPPLPEQERIVEKIEELFTQLDAGEAALKRVQVGLKRYKAIFLKAAVEGKLFNKSLSEKKLPNGWNWSTVGKVSLSMKNGIYKPAEFYSDNGIACLRMYNIEDGKLIWKDIKRMSLSDDEYETYRLNPGDILINRVNSRKLVGKATVIPEGLEPLVYESKNIRLKCNNEIVNSVFLNYCFFVYGHQYFNFNAQQVVGMASINQTQIS